ncbi:MAG: DUF2946 family protein [Woeseiaceae bacterium]|nr:DUF2946 family protein [Woeseiaceae bacterium]
MNGSRRNGTLISLLLLGGMLLRAVIPAGYMPASMGSGLLFELCPDGLPSGVSFASVGHDHAGHHGDSGKSASDHCDLGHLLSGAVIDASSLDVAVAAISPETVDWAIATTPMRVRTPAYSPRAPPFP